jgi:hypothetical protein
MTEPFRCLPDLSDSALEALRSTLAGEQGAWDIVDRELWFRVNEAATALLPVVKAEQRYRLLDGTSLVPVTLTDLAGEALNDNERALIVAKSRFAGTYRQQWPSEVEIHASRRAREALRQAHRVRVLWRWVATIAISLALFALFWSIGSLV